MELTQLRYFLTAAQTEHITQSAERLHIAQPALTKAIHNLEKEVGVPLFSRKGRNVQLTIYGEYLRSQLQPILKSLDDIPARLRDMIENENKTIRLCVLAASTVVTQAVIEFKKKYPDIHFHVLQTPENEMFDIEVTTDRLISKKRDISDNLFVCTEKIFLAVPSTHRLADQPSVRLEEVKDEGFISLLGSKQLRLICDEFCQKAGFKPKIIFDSDSPTAVKNMIAANVGVGFWPAFTWGEIDNHEMKLLEIEQPQCQRDIIVNCKKLKNNNAYVLNFFNFLKEHLKNLSFC